MFNRRQSLAYPKRVSGKDRANFDALQSKAEVKVYFFEFTADSDVFNLLSEVKVGDVIKDVVVRVLEAFNGSTPTLRIGTKIDEDIVATASLSTAGLPAITANSMYRNKMIEDTKLSVTIAGSPTVGSGWVLFEIVRTGQVI